MPETRESVKCPRCGDALVIVECGGVSIDRCQGCGGTYLDESELKKVGSGENAATDNLKALPGAKAVDVEAPVLCVRCSRTMERANFSYSSGIFVDFCNVCGSIWLDNGELEKVIEFMKNDSLASGEDSKKYSQLLSDIKKAEADRWQKDFRSISSSGAMGSVVNYVYRMISKVIG